MTNGSQSKGITITGKNLATWIAIATMLIGSIVDSALTRDQVKRNTEQLTKHNLEVLEVKLEHIEGEMASMNKKLDQALVLITNYVNQD